MREEKSLPMIVLTAVLMSMLLAACRGTPEETTSPTPPSTATLTPTAVPKPTSAPTVTSKPTSTPTTSPAAGATATEEAVTVLTQTAPPSALMAVIVSGDSALLGKPFTFDGTQSRAGSAPIATYQWDMGNGSTLFGAAIQHGYTKTGTYTVTLTITDAEGQTASTAKAVEVIDSAEATPTVAATAESAFPLVGTSWLMENAVRGTTVTLVFGPETLSGSSGCNDYSAGYTATVTEGTTISISVGNISTSNQSCTLEVMAQERGYLESLASASRVAVEDNTLIIETGNGRLTFGQIEDNE